MANASSIAILGPGLLGGSVALAARAVGYASEIKVWARREQAVDEIRSLGLADLASTDLAEVVAGAGLIILATPVGAMPTLTEQLLAIGLPDAVIITDLGSVKGCVVESLDALLADQPNISFVGSHPMAGKEQAGIEHATADLFQGAACVITPGKTSPSSAVTTVENFWQALGCRTTQMDPSAHDAAVARISHLPHLAASLVASTALGRDSSIGEIAGAGLRDTTRVASGAPPMWAEILLENRLAIIPAMRDLVGRIEAALGAIESSDSPTLLKILEEAKTLRDALPQREED